MKKGFKTLNDLTSRSIPECVGRNILRFRKQRRLSQAKLSKAVGVSISYISRIENGSRRNVSYSILNNLSTALDADLSMLFEDDIEKEPLPATANNTMPSHKQFIVWAMKGTIESEHLTPSERLDQLKIIADISRLLMNPIQTH